MTDKTTLIRVFANELDICKFYSAQEKSTNICFHLSILFVFYSFAIWWDHRMLVSFFFFCTEFSLWRIVLLSSVIVVHKDGVYLSVCVCVHLHRHASLKVAIREFWTCKFFFAEHFFFFKQRSIIVIH